MDGRAREWRRGRVSEREGGGWGRGGVCGEETGGRGRSRGAEGEAEEAEEETHRSADDGPGEAREADDALRDAVREADEVGRGHCTRDTRARAPSSA